MYLVRGDLKIELAHVDEGLCGWYNPLDPDDRRLLRFWVSRRSGGGWLDVEGGTALTHLPADLSLEQQGQALELLYRTLQPLMNARLPSDEVVHNLSNLKLDGDGRLSLPRPLSPLTAAA